MIKQGSSACFHINCGRNDSPTNIIIIVYSRTVQACLLKKKTQDTVKIFKFARCAAPVCTEFHKTKL